MSQLNMGIPLALIIGAVAIGATMISIWRREARLRAQRELLRRAYELGEEILSASSAEQIVANISLVAPKIFGVTHLELYLYNRHAKTLDAVDGTVTDGGSIPLGSPPTGPQAGAVACFHYRTLLAIPDTSRSPFPVAGEPGAEPRSLLFVPMLAQGEVVGVLEMHRHDHARDFSRDEQALAQHLGNQIGVAVKLLDQRSVREQLFRTEKLAAVGQLISGIVNDLQTPLATIANLAQGAGDLAKIATEARRASEIVTRLVGFAGAGQMQPQPVELNGLLRSLIEFREREWKVRGIRVSSLLGEPTMVIGSQSQLEEVFLNLLVHAEQSLSDSSEKLITIQTSLIGRRVLVEIGYSGPRTSADPFSRRPDEGTGTGLGVCRGLIAGHGGEIRLVQAAAANPVFQIELPCSREKSGGPAAENGRNGSHLMTALIIEPVEIIQVQLRGLLTGRGYRVVPVRNSDEGLDLAQRLRFDAVFCSVHAPGLNWVETAEQLKGRVGGFVLLSDSYDADLAADFEGEDRFVLSKPVDEKQLDQVLEALK